MQLILSFIVKKINQSCILLLSIFTILFIISCDTTEPLFDKYIPNGTYSLKWNDLPKLSSDKNLRLGGFVGLYYKGNRTFYTVTDRGPMIQNLNENGAKTFFILPSFVPQIVQLELQDDNSIKVLNQINIKKPSGQSTSGKVPPEIWNKDETLFNNEAIDDYWGIYPGGIFFDVAKNYFWISDQYQPSLMQVTTDGEWVRRLRPKEGLRSVLANHTVEGGFTGIDFYKDNFILTITGRSLENNRKPDDQTSKINYALRRVIRYGLKDNNDLSMLYFVEPQSLDGIPERYVLLGDIAVVNDTSYLVTEFANYNGIKRNLLFQISISDSTTKAPVGLEGILNKTIETLSSKERRDNNIIPLKKRLLFNLKETKLTRPEGIAIIDETHIAIIDNNRFGIINGNPEAHDFELNAEPIILEVITLTKKLKLSK